MSGKLITEFSKKEVLLILGFSLLILGSIALLIMREGRWESIMESRKNLYRASNAKHEL